MKQRFNQLKNILDPARVFADSAALAGDCVWLDPDRIPVAGQLRTDL